MGIYKPTSFLPPSLSLALLLVVCVSVATTTKTTVDERMNKLQEELDKTVAELQGRGDADGRGGSSSRLM